MSAVDRQVHRFKGVIMIRSVAWSKDQKTCSIPTTLFLEESARQAVHVAANTYAKARVCKLEDPLYEAFIAGYLQGVEDAANLA